jgi:hypothetical protein
MRTTIPDTSHTACIWHVTRDVRILMFILIAVQDFNGSCSRAVLSWNMLLPKGKVCRHWRRRTRLFDQFSNFCRGQKPILNARSDAWRIAAPAATFAMVRLVSGNRLKAPEDDWWWKLLDLTCDDFVNGRPYVRTVWVDPAACLPFLQCCHKHIFRLSLWKSYSDWKTCGNGCIVCRL